ncbi:MAG: NAD-dependent epimerase/dehydratase family protein [Theionarchaea archaeon]|nr:NAD-dependent epimerase/dehydratase family protein [Theionarchaea archaeon]MBU7036536.1 NAD-dependent epimerase/dehydratase family protein [Theionarchaea archaeon]
MKTLVTGGTGFIGSHLVEALPGDVVCLVRKSSDTSHLEPLGVEVVYGDLTDLDSLKRAARDVDCVYHLGAYYTFHGVWDRYYSVNVQGTRLLIEACESVDHFIYCSSAEAMGPVKTPPADESYPANPAYDYGRSKLMAESLITEKIDQGYPATILRPVGVYGPRCVDDVSYYFMIHMAKNSIFTKFVAGSGENLVDFVFVKDVVQGFLKARNQKAIGGLYFVSGKKALTYNEVYEILGRLLDRAPPRLHVPAVLAKMAMAPLEVLYGLLGREDFMVHVSTVEATQNNRAYSWKRAHDDFGYEPEYSFEKGAEITLQWYREHGYI